MAIAIPAEYADLLSRETKAFAQLALVLSDGAPQVTPMWFDWDGTHVLFNTARGRVKDRLMRKRPVVACSISDPANPYRYVQIRGRVVGEDEAGALEQYADLREKYRGERTTTLREGEVRVVYWVLPERVVIWRNSSSAR